MVLVYTGIMYRQLHVHLEPEQHDFLRSESARTGLSMSELVRRSLDYAYRPESRQRVRGFELAVGLWKRPDAATVGRRLRLRD